MPTPKSAARVVFPNGRNVPLVPIVRARRLGSFSFVGIEAVDPLTREVIFIPIGAGATLAQAHNSARDFSGHLLHLLAQLEARADIE